MTTTKITPKELLDLMNEGLERGEPKVRHVAYDEEGVFCYAFQPTFDGRNKYFTPQFMDEGLQFNVHDYEIIGLSLNQMFSDYSI